ncbi:alpha/beta fold hydrolase [Histidinibacterium aquaticum]|uniref:Alpha/beta hydrolase n=1 Tax=Histidinibacterium aquaticum TaxID=2613962 RepID=A0A5J5GNF3_9RHOB|nr:alpha/beta hydrolase [Histidinibacterium aquaticum]KAA9009074.1 alpha/beta hydrolase [Histidinibacterium aquaticum]
MRILILLLVVTALVIALATLWRVRARTAAAEDAYPPQGQAVEVEGRTVHAVVRGDGPDVVLIHGSSGNTRDMTFRLAERLTDQYRVIVFDRPGLGYTDRLAGDEGIVPQAELLSRAAQALGAERPLVLGQSYGGAVALAWAVHFPERLSALVTVSAAAMPWEGGLPLLYRINSSALGSAVAVPLISAWVPEWYVEDQVRSVFAPQDMPEGYGEAIGAPLTLRPESLRANAAQRATLKDELRALSQRYGEIEVPVEVIHGTADSTVPLEIHAEPLAERIPSGRLTRLEGIGHLPQNVVPGEVAEAVDRAAARAGLR